MKDGRESIGDFALKGGGDYLGHFGTGRSHGVGEGAVVYLTQQQQQKEECNLHIIYVRYSVNRLDCLAPELNRLAYRSSRGRTFITTVFGLTRISCCERPVMGL